MPLGRRSLLDLPIRAFRCPTIALATLCCSSSVRERRMPRTDFNPARKPMTTERRRSSARPHAGGKNRLRTKATSEIESYQLRPVANSLCHSAGRQRGQWLTGTWRLIRLDAQDGQIVHAAGKGGSLNMKGNVAAERKSISRRMMLGATAAAVATPAFSEECRFGPAPHDKGPIVFLNYDQIELDAAYENSVYEPNISQIGQRLASLSNAARARIGEPQRIAYGPTVIEKLDIYRTKRAGAPIFVYIHGGTWRTGSSRRGGFAAEIFLDNGANYVALDFINVLDAGGDLRTMADQVRRGIAWVYKNAESFGGDANKLYVGGHSSGGHLCGVALVTDWQSEFRLPADTIKGGLCMSGMYDLKPVRLSARSNYVKFDDAMEDAMSPIRRRLCT
jgi:arylformamidase